MFNMYEEQSGGQTEGRMVRHKGGEVATSLASHNEYIRYLKLLEESTTNQVA